MTEPHSYASASRHIDLAAEYLRLDPRTAAALRDAHAIAVRDHGDGRILYLHPDGAPVLDPLTGLAAETPAGFLRSVDQDRPDLVGKALPAASEATVSPARAPSTAPSATSTTAIMDEVRAGRLSAEAAAAAAAAKLLDAPPAAKTAAPQSVHPAAHHSLAPGSVSATMTALAVRAKAGDAAAIAEMMSR